MTLSERALNRLAKVILKSGLGWSLNLPESSGGAR